MTDDKNKVSATITTREINPVDFYNRGYVQYTFDKMLKVKNIEQTGIDSFTYVENKEDEAKRMIVIENGNFVAKMKNGLHMKIDYPYSPFMMLQKFIFGNKFYLTLSHIMTDLMNNQSDYIRVGIKYFKKTQKVDRHGIIRNELKVWDKQTVVDDHGKNMLDDMERFDDFTLEPDNKNHECIINNNYNLYAPFEHKAANVEFVDELQMYWTKTLLEHIFGEQYELGIKYIKVLYDYPKQILPILVLTSEERETGKSTFVDYINILFGANTVVINPQDISNSFNASYADKNIVIIEESRFENVQATEKLKNLSTQKKILVNTKHVQQYSIPFYGKIIITSNDEEKFSRVDNPEIRYWVRKIPSLKGKANHNILNDLTNEIPYFLRYLDCLEDVDLTNSRMVFKAGELETDALLTVKRESLPSLHKELEILFEDFCMENNKVKEIMFTPASVKEKWFVNNHRIEINYINKILKYSMKLDKTKMMRYIPFETNKGVYPRVSGRPYILNNPYYEGDDINITKEEGFSEDNY
jgi:hypothetical protein